MMFPLVAFDPITLGRANACLVEWGHKMGPLARPYTDQETHFALWQEGRPVAVALASGLVRESVGGDGAEQLNRRNTIELARLCAARPHLCRVALRLWREFVFPRLGYPFAMSYQDADLHNGNTYRFDGWKRIAFAPGGGTDARSGRKGRDKYVWLWEQPQTKTFRKSNSQFPGAAGAASDPSLLPVPRRR